MKVYYCWRCRNDLPFLDEQEWQEISALISKDLKTLKDYRRGHEATISDARRFVRSKTEEKFEQLTGVPVPLENIYHHRLSDWGPECKSCGHLFRTPRASFCANCGLNAVDNK